MPRHTTTTRFTVMDERVAALEASFNSLFFDALDTKLAVYFEQFRRELLHAGYVEGASSVPRVQYPIVAPILDLCEGEGFVLLGVQLWTTDHFKVHNGNITSSFLVF